MASLLKVIVHMMKPGRILEAALPLDTLHPMAGHQLGLYYHTVEIDPQWLL